MILSLLEKIAAVPVVKKDFFLITGGGNMRNIFRRWVELYSFLDNGQKMEARVVFKNELREGWISKNGM